MEPVERNPFDRTGEIGNGERSEPTSRLHTLPPFSGRSSKENMEPESTAMRGNRALSLSRAIHNHFNTFEQT